MTRIPQFLAAACAAAFFGVFLAYADDFTGQAPKDTYKKVLHLGQATNVGLDTTLRDVHASDGTVSKLQLSTTKVNIAVDALQIAGTDVGATAAELNILDGATLTTAEINVLAGATLTDGGPLLGSGTAAITAMAVLADGEIIVGDGTTDPVPLAAFESSTGDLAVTAGGTGVSTLTDGGILLGSGTADITAMPVLADGEFIVGNGTTDPVAESGSTARISMSAAGTGDANTFTATQTFDALVDIGTVETFADLDATPNVSTGIYWNTFTNAITITDFDGTPLDGQLLYVNSRGAITFDCTASGLDCGAADIVTASGDTTIWVFDGTNWDLIAFKDQSSDMGGGGGPAQATQAALEAETNEDTYAPPDLIQHSPGVAKVWVNWQIDGTINVSKNMTSITDNGAGDWTTTWATNFSGVELVVAVLQEDTAGGNFTWRAQSLATGSVRLRFTNGSSLVDPVGPMYMSAFGDQ